MPDDLLAAEDLVDTAAEHAAQVALLDSVMNPPGDWMDDRGRFYSPWIERGSDGVSKSVQMPTIQDMCGMTAGELNTVCERYGYVPTWESEIDVQKGYLARYNIGPKLPNGKPDPRYAREMARLTENNQRAMLGHTRRLAIRHETLRALEGNIDQRVMIINESDNPCPECEPLGGIEDTYRNLVANNQIPDEVCLGACMCTLMRVG